MFNRKYAFSIAMLALIVTMVCNRSSFAQDQMIKLERPGDREFILDEANLLNEQDKESIRQICDKLLTEHLTPIIVVTLNSMNEYSEFPMQLEAFAMVLFNQWQIGHKELNGENWNTGIMILVLKNDRQARIELGAGWNRTKDEQCQQIMNSVMIPNFKQGNYSQGIQEAVQALDLMARGKELPESVTNRPIDWTQILLWLLFFGLMIFTIVSLIRRGSSGWAWLFWGVVFSVVGYILYSAANSRSSGGGFSGGSFGGGFSGGGGASGSW